MSLPGVELAHPGDAVVPHPAVEPPVREQLQNGVGGDRKFPQEEAPALVEPGEGLTHEEENLPLTHLPHLGQDLPEKESRFLPGHVLVKEDRTGSQEYD